jgi:predicted nucleic acid-binding protein
VEIAHVFRRRATRDEIGDEHGRAPIAALNEFPLRRYRHGHLLPRVWELRHNLTACDATYVALV